MSTPDLILTGGRVIDPESGTDAVRHVAVTAGRISDVSVTPLVGPRMLDVAGRVVAPGFIDIHSHAQTASGLLLQAADGVTTALELEAGALPVAAAYRRAGEQGRPINYGYSASWALARMHLLDETPVLRPELPLAHYSHYQGGANWRRPANRAELSRILGRLEEGVGDGAIGLGVLLGYAPQTERAEYVAVAALAERLGVPAFTHARYIASREPHSSLEGALEIVAAAAGTGAHLHLCHLNSTSNRQIDEIASLIERARTFGLRVSTEAYPYGSASTVVGAPFLAPEELPRLGIDPAAITYLRTGERIADDSRLRSLRASDPGGLVVFDWLDESNAADRAVLERSLLFADTAIASDAMPLVDADGRFVDAVWPLQPDAFTHPRSLNCYSRAMRWLVRDTGLMSLSEVVRRCSLLPAQILESAAPALRRKGRVQVGADADLVVFDPDRITGSSTSHRLAVSTGIDHVLVGGDFVVRDGEVLPDARPGQPVFGVHRATRG